VKKGDVVIAAGVYYLTVEAVGDDLVRCVWFEGNKLRKKCFKRSCLRQARGHETSKV
jgi:uncharacterized protein YodC (DUF2158 family)